MDQRGKSQTFVNAQQMIKLREKQQMILMQQQKLQIQLRQQQALRQGQLLQKQEQLHKQQQSQKQINIPVTPVNLDSSVAMKIISNTSMINERALMVRNDIWHKIQIVRGGNYEMEFVLKSILNAVYPADLIPVRYQIHGEDSFFLVRNCGAALEKLCQNNLIISSINDEPLILMVTLGFASIHDIKINIQPLLISLLNRRHDLVKKSIYLDSFHRDPELSKTVYCPLIQTRTFNHVLKLIRTSFPSVTYLSLQKNELPSINPLENCNLTCLKSLDLRYNQLLTMNTLAPLKNIPLNEIWLDGNPLCENYSSPEKYIDAVKYYIPSLIRLDGLVVSTGVTNAQIIYKSYFKNDKFKSLVEQFVTHFFTFYDQKDRSILRGLYHEDALFSVTLATPPSTAGRQDLLNFMANNRNIFNLNNYKSHHELLFRGHDAIIEAITRYPPSQHLKDTFKVDLMYECSDFLMICIEGLFKNLETYLGFNRTFIIVPGEDNEYNIVNDQLNVSFPPTDKFILDQNREQIIEKVPPIQLTCLSEKEKEELVDMLCDVTTMNERYCFKHLEKIGWDIRKAIKEFMYLYKSGSIPPEAFIKSI